MKCEVKIRLIKQVKTCRGVTGAIGERNGGTEGGRQEQSEVPMSPHTTECTAHQVNYVYCSMHIYI